MLWEQRVPGSNPVSPTKFPFCLPILVSFPNGSFTARLELLSVRRSGLVLCGCFVDKFYVARNNFAFRRKRLPLPIQNGHFAQCLIWAA